MHARLTLSRKETKRAVGVWRSTVLGALLCMACAGAGIDAGAQTGRQGNTSANSTASLSRGTQVGTLPASDSGVPKALADSTFWRLVNELSEPAGWFRSENLVSNEVQWQHVIASLTGVVPRGRAYLGVGPEQNFTYIAALQPSVAFIVDIRRQNLALQLWYKGLFELAETRAEFLSMLFARPRPIGLDTSASADRLFDAYAAVRRDSLLFEQTWRAVHLHHTHNNGFALSGSDLALMRRVDSSFAIAGPDITYAFVLEYDQSLPGARRMPSYNTLLRQDDGHGVNRSFLGSEAAYRAVRRMQLRNLIIPVTGDFGGDHALRAVAGWLHAHQATVGTFYLSNVEQYLFQDNDVWPRFYANVAALPMDSTSMFIRSVTNRWSPTYGQGALMSQLVAPMQATVQAFQMGRVLWYGDVIQISLPVPQH